jgi:hypothetical protein
MKKKQDYKNQIEHLEGITLQMYRILDGLEKAGHIETQMSPLVESAINEYMKYIGENV